MLGVDADDAPGGECEAVGSRVYEAGARPWLRGEVAGHRQAVRKEGGATVCGRGCALRAVGAAVGRRLR